VCGKEVSNLKNHHNYVHLKVKNFPCDQCDHAYTSSTALKQHIRSFHLGQTEKCPT
jgi:hypothetical protein